MAKRLRFIQGIKMAIIDIDRMYREIEQTMKNNFSGTPLERYKQAKKLFLDTIAKAIEDNKEELLKGQQVD